MTNQRKTPPGKSESLPQGKVWKTPKVLQLAIQQTQNSFIVEGPETGGFSNFINCGDNPICLIGS